MNKLDKAYLQLVQDILDYGVEKKDRTGTGTKSIFGYTIRHKMSDGFPLLTTKKMAWKTLVTELLWFLRGDTNINYLVDNDCHIWDGDAYKRYVNSNEVRWPKSKEDFIQTIKTDDEFAKKWGELGPIYGKQWRSWNGNGSPLTKDYEGNISSYLVKPIDQIANLINDLKTNPDSRRLMVSAWNVGELDQMVLPPCHHSWQIFSRELNQEELHSLYPNLKEVYEAKQTYMKNMEYENAAKTRDIEKQLLKTLPTRAISLMWNQRSCDVGLGAPFNIASYGLLLEIIAKITNMVPDELIGNLGDTHLYLNHIEPIKEQLKREPFELPKLVHMKTDEFWKEFDMSLIGHLDPTDFTLENYQSHSTIKLPLSN